MFYAYTAYKQTNKKTQNGPSVSQLKISSDLSNDCKISPAIKESCSSKLRKYNMVSNILLLKEATTEALTCSKESVPFDAEQKPKISQLLSILSKPAYQT